MRSELDGVDKSFHVQKQREKQRERGRGKGGGKKGKETGEGRKQVSRVLQATLPNDLRL